MKSQQTVGYLTTQVLCLVVILLVSCGVSAVPAAKSIQVGAQRSALYLASLQGKRVGLVVNQTSRVGKQHLLDYLLMEKINVQRVFTPEHGLRGDHDAGAQVNSEVDAQTGIPITSIYGQFKQPPQDMMTQLDVVLFDIQDVGVRFYTYISSMHYMMQAAAQGGVKFIVLDRPNPNGRFVDGPVLKDEFRSFVGMHPIPVLHGMTVAELARMIKGEKWIKDAQALELITVPIANYNRDMAYSLPVAPSPNLPNDQAMRLYPSLCFFEATALSVGRGTDFPFQVVGHDKVFLGDFSFSPTPRPGRALHPKLQGKNLKGLDLSKSDIQGLDLSLLIKAYQLFTKHQQILFSRPDFMDKLAGTDELRLAIEAGKSEGQIRQSWQGGLQ
ncbi:MAG: hypothetical protein ACI9C4_002080, partial [Paraglaciecola sp.]